MKRIFLTALFFQLFAITAFSIDAYSYLQNDTLVIGNQFIERKFVWNNGNLITHSLTDKSCKHTWYNKASTPDFVISKDVQTIDGVYASEIVHENSIRPSYLSVTILYSLGGLDIKRVYRIYEDAPTIACDTYLKGNASGILEGGKSIDLADLKNIEFPEDMKYNQEHPQLDHIMLEGMHWDLKAVEFFDVTDINNTLVQERKYLPYRKNYYRGNILFAYNKLNGKGLFFLKEAPCSSVQLAYNGFDFIVEFAHFSLAGLGIKDSDIKADEWTKTYSGVIGVYEGSELNSLKALRAYQKNIRKLTAEQEEMVMMNTWGDRGQDTKVNEKFCLMELEKGAKLGISHFQIDDGWQMGRTPNSAFANGSFKDIWSNKDYWKPDPVKFPHGLDPIVKKGKELNIKIGLWFNPSVQDNFACWEKDAQVLIDLYHKYDIRVFKIDGLKIPNKTAEINLKKLFDTVLEKTNNQVMFNLDATAGRRGGYHMFNEYGNIFLENRYTDWMNYYPYFTLRNIWHLSRYVPVEKIQVEFLNKWRNTDKYDDDIYAPANYSFEYLFAITMAGQPLAWFESTGLPKAAFDIAPIIKAYKKIQHDFHSGIILPIGDEPSGNSWTGFQSIKNESGYLLCFRENTLDHIGSIKTWLDENTKLKLIPVLGKGELTSATVGKNGTIEVNIPQPNGYVLLKYEIIK